ncbi:MAG: carbon-nitrogen hydrolase family protein [Microthrixaceae bacterium]
MRAARGVGDEVKAGAFTVAAVQATPVLLDRDATVERLVAYVEEAAASGAQLVAFPEAIVPGYPDWVWRTKPWSDRVWYQRLWEQAVEIPGPVTDALGAAARRAGAWLALGVSERVASGTLYNSVLYLAPDGSVAGLHRKLLATGGERTLWGHGDGSTLTVLDMGFARVGALTCWENLMPLARVAMYEQGIDVLLTPTWDNSDSWPCTLRHIAREGRVFVVGTNSCLHARDIPRSLPGADDLYPGDDDDWLARGNTMIVGPYGNVIEGPLTLEAGMLTASLDLATLVAARREFDPVGHYARPDVFTLTVHQPPAAPAATRGEPCPTPPSPASDTSP